MSVSRASAKHTCGETAHLLEGVAQLQARQTYGGCSVRHLGANSRGEEGELVGGALQGQEGGDGGKQAGGKGAAEGHRDESKSRGRRQHVRARRSCSGRSGDSVDMLGARAAAEGRPRSAACTWRHVRSRRTLGCVQAAGRC